MKFLVLFALVASAAASLVEHPGGAVTPVETPSVAAAKAAHFAAKGFGAYAPYYGGYYGGYAGAYGYGAYPYAQALQAYPNGAVVPVDEPAVLAAKADHAAAGGAIAPVAAYAGAYGYGAYPYAGYGAGYYGYGAYPYAQALQAYPNGAVVPVDEPAVLAAKADHAAAGGAIAPVAAYAGAYGYAGALGYAGAYGYAPYYGYPALQAFPNGAVVPVDEPAVAEARAEHLAALAAAH